MMRHGGNVWQSAAPDIWLDFSANLRPEGTPEWVMDAMRGALNEARYYPDIAMHRAREGLALYAGVPVECILPTAGGIAAIDAACRLSTGNVFINEPTFGEYARRAAACGRKAMRGTAEDVRVNDDSVFICNPNNPTGYAFARAELLAIAGDIARANAQLIVDEAFIDYCPELSVRDHAATDSGLIAVGSLTKILCVPGVRLGYIIARPEVIARVEQMLLPWELNAFATAIARALPTHLADIHADCLQNIARREEFKAMLSELGTQVSPSMANFLLVDFQRPMDDALELLKHEHILARQCASFGLSANYLRLAVKTSAQNKQLIAALERILS